MATKEVPITIRQYYKSMVTYANTEKEKAIEDIDSLKKELIITKNEILDNIKYYKDTFNLNVNDYEEFVTGTYTNGCFYKISKSLFINNKNNYELVPELYTLYIFVETQKKIYDLYKKISFYDKMCNIKLNDYIQILKTYYTKVQEKLVIEGEGYAFTGRIGWICINRVVMKRAKPILDYAATKKREAELKAAGIKIYNKEEADWCSQNGIEYNAVDKRVFRKNDHFYEMPLIGCTLTNGSKYKLEFIDYRGRELRGKTNDQLIEESNGNLHYIVNLPLDIRAKINICEKIDKILYTKFIRNENQTSLTYSSSYSKN